MELLSEWSENSKGPVVLSPPLRMVSDANAESQTEPQHGHVQEPEGREQEGDVNHPDQVAMNEQPDASHHQQSVSKVESLIIPPVASYSNEDPHTKLQNEQVQSSQIQEQNEQAQSSEIHDLESTSIGTEEVELFGSEQLPVNSHTSDYSTTPMTMSEASEEPLTKSQNEQARVPQNQIAENRGRAVEMMEKQVPAYTSSPAEIMENTDSATETVFHTHHGVYAPVKSMNDAFQQPAPKETTSHDQTAASDVDGNQKPSAVKPATSVEVIDLLDSDDDDDDDGVTEPIPVSQENHWEPLGHPAAKRQRMEGPTIAGIPSYQSQAAHMPGTVTLHNSLFSPPIANQQNYRPPNQYLDSRNEPIYLEPVPGYIPCWKELLPPKQIPNDTKKMRWFQLSLLNVSEFTITGLRVGDEYSGYMTSLAGLRSHIKHISKGYGNAFYERDADGDGKWHIPLGAYHAFYGFLKAEQMCKVGGIPEEQLKIASLGKARLEKDYPSPRKLMKLGVPTQLAKALAPFQRGGVDFVIEKEGRALIADEMGLGKSIQGIASMSVYHQEWPLLVLSPSSARYHWENEFRHWLGKNSAINQSEYGSHFSQETENDESEEETSETKERNRPTMSLLEESQIHVLTASKQKIFPNASTKVVIVSYGLAPMLVANESIRPGMFKCCIVDESHMLKNMATQRSKTLLPILKATDRCILLSGTPAFARPMELWPQLTILGTERDGWWQSEGDFIRKYVRSSKRRAELHTMLMGTVMIRRMKSDILKTLPAKVREQGIVDVMDASTRKEMQECMVTLRTGKGRLCRLAQEHADFQELTEPQEVTDKSNDPPDQALNNLQLVQARSEKAAAQLAEATERLQQEIHHRRAQEQAKIRETLAASPYQLDPAATYSFVRQMENRLEHDLNAYYQERLQIIAAEAAAGTAAVGPGNPLRSPNDASQPETASAKKAILNYMYSLTGNVKVPFVVEMLKRWLNDPTRGKLCLFAHHLAVLNAIAKGAGLSNAGDSLTKFIRIDGSTSPQARQEQINAFQGDPSIRIALLGITAAGVAVTLTACSTIWFAEIFWTPAIMIQAEDRCHRIGQQAQVHCLYFVAKGTLDELLWKLLENKFQDLGEFVEGKEKMKMVVNKSYHSKHELLKSIETDLTDFGDEGDTFSEADLSDIAEIGSDIEHEIEELGVSELGMLDAEGDNDDSEPDSQQDSDSKPAGKEDITGKSENEAICLSDDDDEVEAVSQAAPQAEIMSARVPDGPDSQVVSNPSLVFDKPYPQLKVYKLRFHGQGFGIVFSFVAGRLVVVGRSEDRVRTLGLRAKPHVGDVLAAVNGIHIPIVASMELITRMMIAAKRKGEVELCFGEDIFITSHVIKLITVESTKRAVVLPPKQESPVNVETNDNGNQMKATPTEDQAGSKSDELIELIDDGHVE